MKDRKCSLYLYNCSYLLPDQSNSVILGKKASQKGRRFGINTKNQLVNSKLDRYFGKVLTSHLITCLVSFNNLEVFGIKYRKKNFLSSLHVDFSPFGNSRIVFFQYLSKLNNIKLSAFLNSYLNQYSFQHLKLYIWLFVSGAWEVMFLASEILNEFIKYFGLSKRVLLCWDIFYFIVNCWRVLNKSYQNN